MIFLKSKVIGFPHASSNQSLSKVQVVWHPEEIRTGRKDAEMRMGREVCEETEVKERVSREPVGEK